MKITIEFKMDNAAFQDDPDYASVLVHDVARRIVHGMKEGKILDAYGNSVGQFLVEKS